MGNASKTLALLLTLIIASSCLTLLGNASKTLALLLTLIIASSCLTLLTTKPADAQTIPKPSIPEFTATYVDRSYTVPETPTVDPFTGQTVTNPSYIVENRTIEIAVKNQPFIDSSTDAESKITLMYQIRTKGHFGQDWTNLSFVEDGFFAASNSTYTTITPTMPFPLKENAQVDFQVKALIGYVSRSAGFMSWYFTGKSSDWSPTQTVTISAASNPTQTPSPTPTVPELSRLAVVPLLLSVFAIAIVVRRRKIGL